MHPLVFLLAGTAVFLLFRRSRRSLIYPPGPKGVPILGNLFDIPTEKHWAKFTEWGQTFGDVVFLNVPGAPMVILNSAKATNDLLEKRSANYSDRPYSTLINDMMGWDFDVVFIGYSERWRKYRRLFHQSFNQRAAEAHYPVQMAAASVFLKNLLDKPQDFASHAHQFSGSIILRLIYGYDVKYKHESYVALAEEATNQLIEAATPGKYYVDFLPILKHVPAWMPGAGFKRTAAEWTKTTIALIETPWQMLMPKIADGTAAPCFVTEHLARVSEGDDRDDVEAIKNCAAMMFLGGADTTYSAVASFILAAVLYPEVQKKAQAELDAVVGTNRLPDFSDRPHLPYIEAILSETLRWNPALPMGFVHRSIKEDAYNGQYIPAGSYVIGNVWAILRNEVDYPEPAEFKPERFIKVEGKELPPDPATIAAFGFGRRICPGRYLATNNTWLAIASFLSVFTADRALDHSGREIVPDANAYTDGHIRHPLPFKCVIKPRSEEAARLVRVAADNTSSRI